MQTAIGVPMQSGCFSRVSQVVPNLVASFRAFAAGKCSKRSKSFKHDVLVERVFAQERREQYSDDGRPIWPAQ